MKQNIIQTKKGIALNQAFGAVLMLVLIGVLVIIAIFMFVTLGDTFSDIEESVINETGAYINLTGYTLTNASDCNFNTPVITALWNATSPILLIDSANYTVSSAGVLTNLTESDFSTGSFSMNVSYTYLQGGAACDATSEMVTQFGNYPALVGLIGTIIFLGIVIGVLVASFVFGRKSGI